MTEFRRWYESNLACNDVVSDFGRTACPASPKKKKKKLPHVALTSVVNECHDSASKHTNRSATYPLLIGYGHRSQHISHGSQQLVGAPLILLQSLHSSLAASENLP